MPPVLRTLCIGILLTISVVAIARADPILVHDGRFVAASALVNAQPPVTAISTPSAPFSPFEETATATAAAGGATSTTTATQHSSIGPALLTASGTIASSATVSDTNGFAFATGSSTFEIEFDLASPDEFALTGSMAVGDMQEGGGFGEVEVSFGTEPASGGIDVIAENDIRFGSESLDFTGVLTAGRHRLFAEASTESVANDGLSRHGSNFDIQLALTPTPEPGSLLLLGTGALLLKQRSRKDPAKISQRSRKDLRI